MIKKAYFAGGCFWGLEDLIRTQPGVTDTEVGYTGGKEVRGTSARLAEDFSEQREGKSPASGQPRYEENDNPTYENHPGHAEAVQIEYDDEKTSYTKLLDFFFQIHNPTTLNQQGNDRGTSYRSAIFYQNDEEKNEAEKFIEIVNESERWSDPVVTTLEPFTRFWPAEGYHQDYLVNNPNGYTCHAVYYDSYLK